MSENLQKIIFMGASILMTVAIIAVGMRVFSTANEIVLESEKEMVKMHTGLSNNKYDVYDNGRCRGYEVINVIKMIDKDKLEVKVETSEGTEVTYNNEQKYKIIDEYDADYINPNGKFSSTIEYNQNEIISGIIFKQI